MKNTLLFTALIIVLGGFVSPPRLHHINEDDPGIDSFANIFMAAVMAKNENRLMGLMDDGYRLEQHDKFHKGNTKRFLDELFCGKVTTEERFKCIKLKNVKSIQLGSKGEGDKEVAVVFRVGDKKEQIDVILTIKITLKNGKKEYGIVGAVG